MPKPIYLFSTSKHPEAINVASLEIELLKPTIDFSKYDYLIITSKQASEALKQYDKSEYIHIPSLCVSKKSAEAYEALGGKVLACGNGYGEDLSKTIQKFPHAKRWLYLRAEVIASDFISTCQREGCNIDTVVVYKSQCSQNIRHVEIEQNAVLIFTSPSSVNCFLDNHTINQDSKIIVIGETTAKALPRDIEYIVSKERTIENCMDIALRL
ncbi:MAG: uroporphyrinogen-III synthase [Epsilonproteobacteria bacterium]|nr:uroporphyrinogen-III synthase [Campylobacterota bacterium]OIO16101.1 MAG: uroporphyrinogen-III synthase [Helicobacteraceae bacterium CG1_02_36_14]PIP10187.1 MAG: uroporphyrinogen-III synthase [Sulfurimonas sp. CG23_combo_of_CG06-09_8_20_14_all_36_33]PIS26493.1 MAG: uroporphyrinogen-III synthase [Sulfurimonas sp. CG08_land_8_20_14_0_20_36_33]PIU33955.1 MAG: uroporphyrinogen-III synthase [Sulfurimonas sp. CG07_land_8_20_14_0_80_36_56]PIV03783.1 MAG: uroporphyrinogen-III synthase [Sulfurimonas